MASRESMGSTPAATGGGAQETDALETAQSSSSLTKWSKAITTEYQRGVDWRFSMGEMLIAAKAELDQHGQWLALIRGGLVPFSEDSCERFMRVAAHELLKSAALRKSLPLSMTTLSELARLTVDELQGLIDRGFVDPTLTSRIAASLVSTQIASRYLRKREAEKRAEQDAKPAAARPVQSLQSGGAASGRRFGDPAPASNVVDMRRRMAGNRAANPNDDGGFARLLNAWNAATPEARSRFKKSVGWGL
jgi:hypothetical protein